MFDTEKIYTDELSGKRFLCDMQCQSSKRAKYIAASFLISIRMQYPFADLYAKGSLLILDTPDKQATIMFANKLNEAISCMH